MGTVAIGDIHGQLKPLRDLLERVRPDIGAGDTVVFLGDYIDRGRDTRACVDAILDFRASVPATVTCLRGNHEAWMLQTRRDPCRHSWLLGMQALTTIRSYSTAAAETIAAAAADAGGRLYEGGYPLPYDSFFEAMPDTHHEFFDSLHDLCETTDCVCAHGGLDPSVEGLEGHGRALVWGAHGFPEHYRGERPVVYGHHNNADVDDADWPHPRIVGATYGIDTIAHGVLTAIRWPGPFVLQSARYERRRR